MKFGKSLSSQIEETLPEWRDKFLSYKDLKKKLKLIAAGGDRPAKRAKTAAGGGYEVTREEEEFLGSLEDELEKFNVFFVEKEEEYIIRQKELQELVAMAIRESKEELMKVRKEIVDFHGEMVLLENYSALNYTGLVKILKKYDKRTGALIRLPFIQKVLQQPFFITDLLYKLVKECESMLDHLFSINEPSSSPKHEEEDEGNNSGENPSKPPRSSLVSEEFPDLDEIEYMESLYMKSTVSALRVLKEIRSGSSTVSVFSLPPLKTSKAEERIWDKVPVVEQLAK
ncbi:uncharacterized protein A4U43_C06F10180 [Asparagus officinalis]|uniref:SPX domain-containing protein n=1 Tax=Asparagus officinalis TaxID=4686 RepID=A0A5P1ELG8_ASPOF|nr:SPX domain-containing protein 1-like [Asparagus officinalis]ONK66614.1 uncharacterized protein A4U43_C06F10180 [Asparagus officinalis]